MAEISASDLLSIALKIESRGALDLSGNST